MKQITWQEAARMAVERLDKLGLGRDLRGLTMHLADYADAESLRQLKPDEPDLTLDQQRILNAAFARELLRRGARVFMETVSLEDYMEWLESHGLENNPANRAQYVAWRTCPEPKFTPRQPRQPFKQTPGD